jgi:hypothetical protein
MAIIGMAVNASAVARYGTKGISLTSRGRMVTSAKFVVNQNLMYGTAVFVKPAERQGTHLAMTVSAFTVGRARSSDVMLESARSFAWSIAVAAARKRLIWL